MNSFLLLLILAAGPMMAKTSLDETLDGALADQPSTTAVATPKTGSGTEVLVAFSLPGLDGKIHALSDYRGDWVVVNYWATWCAPCRKEIPDLSQFHDARADITVLGLAFEDTEIEVFREFLIDYPASYPILLVDVYDPPADFGAPRALPTTYLIDPDGEMVNTWIGPITSAMISDWIAENG